MHYVPHRDLGTLAYLHTDSGCAILNIYLINYCASERSSLTSAQLVLAMTEAEAAVCGIAREGEANKQFL